MFVGGGGGDKQTDPLGLLAAFKKWVLRQRASLFSITFTRMHEIEKGWGQVDGKALLWITIKTFSTLTKKVLFPY